MWKCEKYGRAFKNENQSHYCGEKPRSIEAYIVEQDATKQPDLFYLHRILSAALPGAEERICRHMPTYWKDCNIIQFAASKNYIGLYPGAEAVAHFARALTEYEVNKGTMRIPYRKIDAELIQAIAKWCLDTAEQNTDIAHVDASHFFTTACAWVPLE